MSRAGSDLPLAKASARGLKIRVLAAAFNRGFSEALLRSVEARLKELGGAVERVDWVPGALELPLAARWAVSDKGLDAVIALGCVIRGDTSHYDLVCQGALDGLQRVSLDCGVPVLFGVLTVENAAQARARSRGDAQDAGRHAANAAVIMALLKKSSRRSAVVGRRASTRNLAGAAD